MNIHNSKNLLISISLIFILLHSCKKEDDFHVVSNLELQVHQKINDLRQANSQNTLVFQPLLFKPAREHSEKMADLKKITNAGLDKTMEDLASKLGANNAGYILDTNAYEVADSVINKIMEDKQARDVIYETYTQAGVAISAGADNIKYITILFMNIP